MIGIYHTTREPMRGFVDYLNELEERPEVLSISFLMGFPWGDVPDMGTKILVITNDKEEQGNTLAEEIGKKLFSLHERYPPTVPHYRRGIG